VEDVLELLADLASKGIKLSIEGDNLGCYAPKGSLTREVRDCIARNKPTIIRRLKDYIDFQQMLASTDAKGKTQEIGQPRSDIRQVALSDPPLDLMAEAVLDPEIQPAPASAADVDLTAAKAILLTGASGFLGAYLLHDLLTSTEASMYCLVRCRSHDDGANRIKNNLLKYGLWSNEFVSRIVPVPGDLASPRLGVGTEQFDHLCNVVDTVFHNGAMVNFIYSYGSLKDSNVRGTEEVIRLACRTRRKPLHFISTIGVFPPATKPDCTVFESDPPANWQSLIGGYPQSKWVAEKIVTIASDRGLPVRIYRPGFVTGDSATGTWNTDDFLSRLIKGCIQLRSAPDISARVEMVPVDYVSQAIVALSRRRELSSNIFHIVGSHYIPLGDLFRIIASLGYNVKLLPYAQWRKELFDDAKISSKNALFPLLTGFATSSPWEMPVYDCENTRKGLEGTQIVCPEIHANLVAAYLGYFHRIGFLDDLTGGAPPQCTDHTLVASA
jgi:thioester reductase-like protein